MLKKLKDKFRYTKLHYFLLKFTNPNYINWIRNEFIFHKKFLNKNKIIFDLGANIGDKSYIFSAFAKKVFAYEPENKMHLILKNRFINKNVVIKKKLFSNKKGYTNFYIVDKDEAYSTIKPKSLKFFDHIDKKNIRIIKKETTTLNLEIKKNGIPDYIKIDCEGAEKLILQNLIYKIPILSFELNLPQFYKEGEYIIMSFKKKFKSEYNIRIHEKNEFLFKKNVSANKCLRFLKNKNIVSEVFIFS
tara:strand:- start:717 stop:1454 length:738 start_codon:yes stop_codon:yes gene_type:complete